MTGESAARGAGLTVADEDLMSGRLAPASAAYALLLDELGGDATSDDHEGRVYRAALLVRSALCHYLAGAEQEADEMLGYLDRLLSVGVRDERDAERAGELAEIQDNVRYYRLRLAEASAGGPLEFPVTLCQHDRQVPLLPCGFVTEHS